MPSRLPTIVAAACFLAAAALAEDASLKQLIERAERDAPDEVQLHVIKTSGRLSGFFAKVREVYKVDGWQQIRAEGEAAYAAWDNRVRDFVWQSAKFEVLWDITDRGRLKLNAVSVGGIERKADP